PPAHFRVVSRLAQAAGVRPHAPRVAPARAGDVPHVLARAQRRLVAARATFWPQAGAAGESVLRDTGPGALFAHLVVRQRPVRQPLVAAISAAAGAAHL